jgi:hypothetical protein
MGNKDNGGKINRRKKYLSFYQPSAGTDSGLAAEHPISRNLQIFEGNQAVNALHYFDCSRIRTLDRQTDTVQCQVFADG